MLCLDDKLTTVQNLTATRQAAFKSQYFYIIACHSVLFGSLALCQKAKYPHVFQKYEGNRQLDTRFYAILSLKFLEIVCSGIVHRIPPEGLRVSERKNCWTSQPKKKAKMLTWHRPQHRACCGHLGGRNQDCGPKRPRLME